MLKKKGYILALLLSTFIVFFQKVEAADPADIGFYIEQVVPSSQIDFSRSFFYVQTYPREEQTLKVRIVSTAEENKKIEIKIDNAMSTELGIIDYKEPLIVEESLVNPITEILTTENNEIVLEPGEKKTIEFKLKPPVENYPGVKMGKISFINKLGEESGGVIDVYNAYSIDVIATESTADYKHGKILDLIDVTPELSNGRKVIQAQLQNPEPELIKNLEIKAKLINKTTKETVKDIKVSDYALAPNSILPFIFDLGLSNMVAGDYKVTMVASNEDDTWNLEKDFKITEDQAKKINDESPFRIKTPFWIKVTAASLGGLSLILMISIKVRYSKWLKEFKLKRRRKSSKGGRRRA